MKKVLITGGTTFVSKYAAQYFKEHNYDVYVLNRNTKPQVEGVTLIEGNRHELGKKLKAIHFDVVADITAYDAECGKDIFCTKSRYLLPCPHLFYLQKYSFPKAYSLQLYRQSQELLFLPK